MYGGSTEYQIKQGTFVYFLYLLLGPGASSGKPGIVRSMSGQSSTEPYSWNRAKHKGKSGLGVPEWKDNFFVYMDAKSNQICLFHIRTTPKHPRGPYLSRPGDLLSAIVLVALVKTDIKQ
jgi:hypothetical protein